MVKIEKRVVQLESSQHSTSSSSDQSRRDEVRIGDFNMKSKDGASLMVKKILKEISGNSYIIEDRVGNVPTVIPVKFESCEAAQKFIKDFKFKKDFDGHFDGFWCNFSQTKEERIVFNRDIAPLFKIKRAILEEIDELGAARIIVDKSKEKNVVEDLSLQLVALHDIEIGNSI